MNTEPDVVALYRGLTIILARLMDLPSLPIKHAPFVVGAIMYDQGDDMLIGATKRCSTGKFVRSRVLTVTEGCSATAYSVGPVPI